MMEPCSSTAKHDPHHYMHENNGYWCEGKPDRPARDQGDSMSAYPVETLDEDDDDGTMPENVADLEEKVVGHRIVTVEKKSIKREWYGSEEATVITLDNGHRVVLRDSNDCCAFTELDEFLLHPELVDHIITGVGTTDGYSKWHIYADMGDVLELTVAWSAGNPFYYGYGFDIEVIEEQAQ